MDVSCLGLPLPGCSQHVYCSEQGNANVSSTCEHPPLMCSAGTQAFLCTATKATQTASGQHACTDATCTPPGGNEEHNGDRNLRRSGRHRRSLCEYASAGNIRRHQRRRPGERPFVCAICNKGFSEKSKLKRHSRMVHNEGEKHHKCTTCERAFHQKVDLQRHERVHVNERLYACKQCGQEFKQKGELYKHVQAHSGDTRYTLPFKCVSCSATFPSEKSLKSHRDAKHARKRGRYRCQSCDYSSDKLSDVAKHRRTHTRERPFTCDVCNKGFPEKSKLARHSKIVHDEGERCHECAVCGRAFHQKGDLRRHGRVHTDERPYSCDQCGRAFKQLYSLRRHVWTHEGDVQ